MRQTIWKMKLISSGQDYFLLQAMHQAKLNKAEIWKLYSWTRPIIAILSGQLLGKEGQISFEMSAPNTAKSLCFLKNDLPLDVQAALQVCMSADYLFCWNGSWRSGEEWHISYYCSFKDGSKQSTMVITLQATTVSILSKVLYLFWNMI